MSANSDHVRDEANRSSDRDASASAQEGRNSTDLSRLTARNVVWNGVGAWISIIALAITIIAILVYY